MYSDPKNGAAIQVRLTGSEFQSLENWRRAQEAIPPRSEVVREAIRRLLAAEGLAGRAEGGSELQ